MFLYYVYKDELDARLDAELAATVLHIAQYYGAPRLAGLCERLLAREIKNGDAEDEGIKPHTFNVCINSASQTAHYSHYQRLLTCYTHCIPPAKVPLPKVALACKACVVGSILGAFCGSCAC